MNLASGPARWAHLTFSSFDDGVNAGGWQIKQTAGDLTDEEQAFLRSQIITQFDLNRPLPTFPTPNDVAMLPQRLVYLAAEEDRAGYWHTCFAGPDASGRPGNVFAHAVLDRSPSELLPVFRPIDLWRSPDWLAPYGADAVRQARLRGDDRPAAGDMTTLDAVVDFVLDPTEWRTGTLVGLVDAAAAALDGGAPVVLITDSVDEAALWIAAVTRCLSPHAARRLGFSTYQRATELDALWSRRIHMAAVPREDAHAVGGDDAVVAIDSREAVTLGELNGAAHTTEGGRRIAVTTLSMLVESTFLDDESARSVLARADEISVEVGEGRMAAGWTLAAALAEAGASFAHSAPVIDAVLTSHPPTGMYRSSALAELVEQRLFLRIQNDPAMAWRAYLDVEGTMRKAVIDAYLLLAVRNRDWLATPGGAPLPPPGELTTSLDERFVQALQEALGNLLDEADRPQVERSVDVLRLLDFADRTGLDLGAEQSPVRKVIADAVTDEIVPAILGDDGIKVVTTALLPASAPVQELVRSAAERMVLSRRQPTSLHAGWSVPFPVLSWLYPYGTDVGSVDALEARRRSGQSLALPGAYVVEAERLSRADAGDPVARAGAAVWFVLDAERSIGTGALDAVVTDLVRTARPASAQTRSLLQIFGTAVPPALLFGALCGEWTDDMQALASGVLRLEDSHRGRWDDVHSVARLRDLAGLRLLAHRRAGVSLTRINTLADVGAVGRLTLHDVSPEVGAELTTLLVSSVVTLVLLDIEQEIENGRRNTPDKTTATQYGLFGTAFQRPSPVDNNLPGSSSIADEDRPVSQAVSEQDWLRTDNFARRMSVGPALSAVISAIKQRAVHADVVAIAAVLGASDFPFPGWRLVDQCRRVARLRTSNGRGLLDAVIEQLVARQYLELSNEELRSLAEDLSVVNIGTVDDRKADVEAVQKFFRKAWKDIKDMSLDGESKGRWRR